MNFPGIARATLLIALDNGGINRGRSVQVQRRDLEKFLARQPSEILPAIDQWLSGLTKEDLDTFCCGGEGEPETEALRRRAPAFTDKLLNDYFNEVC